MTCNLLTCSGSRHKEVSSASADVGGHLTWHQHSHFARRSIPIQYCRNNRRISDNQLLYQAAPDEKNGHEWRQLFIYVWATEGSPILLYQLWNSAQPDFMS